MKMTATRPVALATPADLSEFIGIPEKTLANWRSDGKGPKYRKIGRHVRYDWDDVRVWLSETRKYIGAA
jgi:predicted DNA-binding transcriptional regulator AlpA